MAGDIINFNVREGTADMPPPTSVRKDPTKPNDEVSEEEKWHWLENMASESERVRIEEAQFDQYDKWMDLFYGQHWPSTMPSFRPPIVVNELRSLVLSEASDLTDSQLRVFITRDPRTGGRDAIAERAFRAVWVNQQVDLKLIYAICWALIVGTGFIRVSWDPELFFGEGDISIEDINPQLVLPDPDAVDDTKWNYVIIETVLDLMDVRRLFPVEGYRVEPEERWSVKDRSKPVPNSTRWGQYRGPMTDTSSLLGRGDYGYKKARARILDCIVNDDSVETVLEHETEPDGSFTRDEAGIPKFKEYRKPKYPKGRRIIGANGTILFDGPNPNPGGDFGLIRVVTEPTLGRFWGTGFVQQTAELQLAADKLMSSVVENAIRLNNGMVVASNDTGLDFESFSGIPGQIVEINRGSNFKIEYPPPMPPDMVKAPWTMLDMQRRLFGYEGPRSGKGQAGNISADLTETDISQSQGNTRLRARLLYFTVQRLAKMIFARMANGYLTERTIPAVEGEKFSPTKWEPLPDPGKWELYVDPGSFQIMSRTLLKRLGLALYRLKAIDRESLLETIGWPNWEETNKRLGQAEMQAAMFKLAEKGRKK